MVANDSMKHYNLCFYVQMLSSSITFAIIDYYYCIGECGPPVAGDGVVIHKYTTTFEGSSITFNCEDGLFPNVTITATCTREGYWRTDPTTYMCINITGTTTDTTTGITTNTTNTMDTTTSIIYYSVPCQIPCQFR